MIKLEALRVFVTVTEAGSLKRAGDILGRTQSALSMTLSGLEEAIGGRLFETERKQTLTELGSYVHGVGQNMLHEHDRGIELIERYAKGKAGRLRIAAVPSVAALLLPTLVQSFLAGNEGAHIDLIDTDSSGVRKAVSANRADIGIASVTVPLEGLEAEFLFCEPALLVCQKDDTLASIKQPLAWSAIQNRSLIMNEAIAHLEHPTFHALRRQSALTVRNVLSLLAMVSAGAGFTVLPRVATVNLPADLIAIPLVDQSAASEVALLTQVRTSTAPLTSRFIEHLRENLPLLAIAPA